MSNNDKRKARINQHFAERILDYRGRAGLTQVALGQKLGVSAPTICQYEHGIRLASKRVLTSMRSVFGLSDREYLELIHLASSVDAEPLYRVDE
tara:strand:+ start:289 stop:570 length:282 start_codon:yes stop_codon:yes gene_type:complete